MNKHSNPIAQLGVCALAEKLRGKEISSREATEAYLAEIQRQNPAINAYITVAAETALRHADDIDSRRAGGQTLPLLAGVPFGMKDNLCTKGLTTTCASVMLANFVPGYHSTVAARLQAAGAVLLGKLNMDEFAMGSSGEHSAFGPVKNPLDQSRSPGGSSAGSAAATAGGMAAFAIGSDTGGSIRQPAAFCGVVGIKPTYGRVSRSGLVAFASSMDQVGPLARSVADCAAVLHTISGHDPMDATTAALPVPNYGAALQRGVKGLRIALPTQALGKELSPEVKQQVLAAAAQLASQGAVVEEISMPLLPAALPAYCILSCAEAASNLGRYDGLRYGRRAEGGAGLEEVYRSSRTQGFGHEVKRRILLGTLVLGASHRAYYQKAQQVHTLVAEEFARVFTRFDLVLTPTTSGTAHRLGKKEDTAPPRHSDLYTAPANLAGLPAISVPFGRDASGMPVGLQLLAKPFEEESLFCAAHALEQCQKGGAA